MKKILVIILLICLFIPTSVANAQMATLEYICITNTASLYTSPSKNGALAYDENGEVAVLTHKDIINIEYENDDAVIYNEMFYKILDTYYDENGDVVYAYVSKYCVTKNSEYIVTIPTYNATVSVDNATFFQIDGSGENAYLDDGTQIYASATIEYGTRIYLYEGFDSSKEFCAVTVLISDKVEYGYIRSDSIQPDGINPLIIYAITITLGCVGIIIALLFMKNKKKKVK